MIEVDDNGLLNIQTVNMGPGNFGVQNANIMEDALMQDHMDRMERWARIIRRSQIRRKVRAQLHNAGLFTGFSYNDLLALAALCRHPFTGP